MEAEGTQGPRKPMCPHCIRILPVGNGICIKRYIPRTPQVKQPALALQSTGLIKGDSDSLLEYMYARFLEAWGAVHSPFSRENQDGNLHHYSPSIVAKLGALATQLFLQVLFYKLPLSPPLTPLRRRRPPWTYRRGEVCSCACMPAPAFLRGQSTSSANIYLSITRYNVTSRSLFCPLLH